MKRTLFCVLMLVMIMLSACQVAQAGPTATTIAPSVTSPISTPNPEQSREVVITGLLAMSAKASRMEIVTTTEDGNSVHSVIEFLPPDHKYLSSQGVEYIVAGDKVFMKSGEQGEWKAAPMPASAFVTDLPTAASIGATVSDALALRQDELNGKDVFVYGFTNTTLQGELTLVSKAELWVNTVDGLPLKFVTDGDTYAVVTDSDGKSKPVSVKAINTTLIDFNTPIKIEPPIK